MAKVRDWSEMNANAARLLRERTGADVAAWNRRIRARRFADERALSRWLAGEGVTGYARDLLVHETFGYPDFLVATADELVDAQYADRAHLRPVHDAIVRAASGMGEVVVQARKTFVALVGPKRTFARIQPTTKDRVDLGLRIDGARPAGRLLPARGHDTMRVRMALATRKDVDAEVRRRLREAYAQSVAR
jgi:hypothetical protein